MPDVFISYSSADRNWVSRLAKSLQNCGLDVWWDLSLKPGQVYREVIQETLDDSDCVIVVWSKDSVKSIWVESEASQALQKGILIPISLDDARIPMPFDSIQTANLNEWKGDELNHEYTSLLVGIAEHCHKSSIYSYIKTTEKNEKKQKDQQHIVSNISSLQENLKYKSNSFYTLSQYKTRIAALKRHKKQAYKCDNCSFPIGLKSSFFIWPFLITMFFISCYLGATFYESWWAIFSFIITITGFFISLTITGYSDEIFVEPETCPKCKFKSEKPLTKINN